jgi:predicted ribosome quality control (RQC) complex YloA/Tae2 family protein
MVTIPLDPQLSPAENAQNYFKRYNKAKRTLELASKHAALTRQEIDYLEGVHLAVENAADLDDLKEIEEELVRAGYLKKLTRKRQVQGKTPQYAKKKERSPGRPLRFVSPDGCEIWVGKNNKQNDEITFKIAKPGDTWLHVKDLPGSHVIVRSKQQPLPESTLRYAAHLAAYFSKGRQSSNVPVDYTLVRHVRKPKGAHPGFVIYDHHRTLYVTPDPQVIESFRQLD